MNTNNTVDVSKITSRLESALENGDDSSASKRGGVTYILFMLLDLKQHSL